MIRFKIIILVIGALIFGCSERNKDSQDIADSNEWELVILDSIQVGFLADIREGTFSNGIGLIKDISSSTLIKFDSLGNILVKKEFPKEGPGSVTMLETLLEHNGGFFGTTSFKNIYHFDADLNLKESLEMPFLGEARGGAYNRRNIAVWDEKILLWYPGRNGISPYLDYFYRDYTLLELYDLKTKSSIPVVRTPPSSKFSGDDFFGRPYINFTIENDSLYLTFSNEPILHIYALGDSVLWERSIDINPIDFKLLPGQKTPVTYEESMKMNEAQIHGIYSDSNNIIVTYYGGIDEDTFVNNNLKERENFFRYPEFRKNYLKIYRVGKGWSNEVILPSKIKLILNIESVDKSFYALRDDDYLGEEQDYITFYKLQLVKK
ncbi:hypothetical protein P872_17340 [Rhodonellum psychrophilum GCM71 = DSM 17998]|uniref:DUF4221 domain-containing protein n=2 Tax=Rhodonellum TaxID=336827 RepID=U5C4I0_9BACT|nr:MULTISPECIES: hypothetical protein [Rhodonellum]ERM83112.1 hypothetical protein P872_17340 [Rhodonellum psychrophilum GCM71 = DSM 17998]SDY98059.1 hypothetical protein SAMN05444412_104157 [Rhodonellum ikkaensis]